MVDPPAPRGTPDAGAAEIDGRRAPRRPMMVRADEFASLRWATVAACALLLAGCAGQPAATGVQSAGGRYFDPILGVWASPRLIGDGEPVPRGGGGYLVGRPYTIGGRTYVPNANPQGYVAVGTASWYGDAFHGRRTANGEIFDKGSISAAHPTLPLPSYVRVTNLGNGRSLIVRVNDRGPYHGGRVMDVSQRVAEALEFKAQGTGHIRIDYVARAGLDGGDDVRLLATLATDGRPARLDGAAGSVEVAGVPLPPRPDGPSPFPNVPPPIAALPVFRGDRTAAASAPMTTLATVSAAPPRPPAQPQRPAPDRALSIPVEPWGRTVLSVGRRSAPDPFYRPLFPPPKPERKPADVIRSSSSPRRPTPSQRSAVEVHGVAR